MKVKLMLFVLSLIVISSCSITKEQGIAADDLYFSTIDKSSHGSDKIIPIDIEKIKKDFPSQVDPNKPSGFYSEGTPNQNAVVGYPIYKETQDSLYSINPQLSGYYQSYSMPPYSLRDQYLQAKMERRQARRLARINNRNNFNNFGFNSGWNNGCINGWNNNGWNNNGWNNGWNNGFCGFNSFNNWNGFNNWGPQFNIGWNNWNGWNTGIGFGFNNWGWNNFYNPWGFYNQNFGFNPWGYYNYYPYYGVGNGEVRNTNPGQSKPRQVIGTNLPATNGGTIDNPNPVPLKYTQSRSTNDANIDPAIQIPNQSRTNGSGGVLIPTPSGVQYVSPSRDNNAPKSYETFEKSVEVEKQKAEIQKANPQIFYQKPVEPTVVTPSQSRSNTPAPTNPQPQYVPPSYQQPANNQPVYTPSRSNNGGSSGGGGSNSGSRGSSGGSSGGGSNSGGGSRPR
jgi:uncharacterized membrane protein YgcG